LAEEAGDEKDFALGVVVLSGVFRGGPCSGFGRSGGDSSGEGELFDIAMSDECICTSD
jgi:hypothetical protein